MEEKPVYLRKERGLRLKTTALRSYFLKLLGPPKIVLPESQEFSIWACREHFRISQFSPSVFFFSFEMGSHTLFRLVPNSWANLPVSATC